MSMTVSGWGSDFVKRGSITSMFIMLSGTAELYKTRVQQSISLSSTEAEFVAGSHTGKATLYLHSVQYYMNWASPKTTMAQSIWQIHKHQLVGHMPY